MQKPAHIPADAVFPIASPEQPVTMSRLIFHPEVIAYRPGFPVAFPPLPGNAFRSIRAAHPAMRRGTRSTVQVDADLWVYELTTTAGDPDPDTVYVGINRSDGDRTTTMLPSGLTELITNTPATGTITIPARETRIFK